MRWWSIKAVVLSLVLYSSFTVASVIEKDGFEINHSTIFTIESKVLDRKYDVFVKLPHDYFWEASKSKKYPVIYLNDGPYTFKVAAGVTHMRKMDKAIVVGISFAHGENGQFSRVRDLTPVVDDSWTKYTTGGATKYLEFIEKEVFQFIEQNYRIDTERRILSGQS
mgnify:CR=1 FL=1